MADSPDLPQSLFASRPARVTGRALLRAALPAALYLALAAAGLAYSRQGIFSSIPYASAVALVVAFGVMMAAGLVIVTARPGHRIGWMLVVAALSAVGYLALAGLVAAQWASGALWGVGPLAAWLIRFIWMGYAWVLMGPLLLTYPTGRLLSPRWQPVYWIIAIQGALLAASYALAPGPAETNGPPNPFGVERLAFLDDFALWLDAQTFSVTLLLSLSALAVRYHRAPGEQRAQIRWLLFVVLLFAAYNLLGMALTTARLPWFGPRFSPYVFTTFVAAMALAIAVALLRYRLYDIDIIIRRTLSYSIVTAMLAFVYLGTVVMLQQIFTRLAGSESSAALALSTLAIALLFNPLRLRVQEWLDRRYYRRRYDARGVIDRFNQATRDEADLERMTAALAGVVAETLQPRTLGVWLATKRERRP